ncbi:unnamed protein product [Blepharisma stoltei]|uniref:Uncharacterized protein n=1 Tax=Blepharisma stoltei TaxID=1481888 RepID=A0AAU9JUY6_9CILI|nr:unnamed protein product [Blepharisma stoltei]
MEPFLVCQKKFWQKDPNLPLHWVLVFPNFLGKPNAIKKIVLLRWCIWLVKKIWQHQNSVVMAKKILICHYHWVLVFPNFFDKPNASSQKNNFFIAFGLPKKFWKHQNSVAMAD